MTAALGEALRLLGLPVDRTVDAPMLASAYRDAARNAHPDAAAPEERDTQTERMRAVNLARDLVRNHLHALGAEPYAAFAPGRRRAAARRLDGAGGDGRRRPRCALEPEHRARLVGRRASREPAARSRSPSATA